YGKSAAGGRFLKEILDSKSGGADRDRTCDPHNAIVVLYQLSYDPIQSGGNFKENGGNVKEICPRNEVPIRFGVEATMKLAHVWGKRMNLQSRSLYFTIVATLFAAASLSAAD